MIPGIKDCVSIEKDGKKVQVQKRLLMFNLKDAHEEFMKKHPEAKIGLTKFSALRPRQCILADKSGTHNVCTCKIHKNNKLKLFGVKQEL